VSETATFHGFCDESGTFTLDVPAAFRAYVAKRFKGEEVTLEVYKRRTKRSDKQNRYLHAALTGWARDLGYDIEDLKDALLEQVFGRREIVNPLTGEVKHALAQPHTSTLSTAQFSELVERMVEIAAGTGYIIELPDEFKTRSHRASREKLRRAS
jgi:dGTP triphosphohydrolase